MVLAPQVPTNANNAPAKESVTRLAATDDSLFADATTGITGGIMDEETKAKYDEKADLAGAGKFCTVPPPMEHSSSRSSAAGQPRTPAQRSKVGIMEI